MINDDSVLSNRSLLSKIPKWIWMTIIVGGAVGVAYTLVVTRPQPERLPAPVRVPFAITAPIALGEGPIPVYGAGTVRARASVDVTAEVAGRVVWVASNFQSGGRVRAGQELFQIDDADYVNKLERARAGVAMQEVEVLRITAEAQVAREQYEQFQSLPLGAELTADPLPLASWEPQLKAAQAGLTSSHAALREAELALMRTKVFAPFNGVVTEEYVSVGQFVAPAQRLGSMYAVDAVEVVVPLTDANVALIPGIWELQAGDRNRRVPTRVIAEYGGERYAWDGYVDRAEADLDATTRTIKVIIRVPNPLTGGSYIQTQSEAEGRMLEYGAPPLIVGKYVEVEVEGLELDEYYTMPREALRPGNEVWTVQGDTVNIVPVDVLQRSNDVLFVSGAFETTQTAIVGGVQTAVNGHGGADGCWR